MVDTTKLPKFLIVGAMKAGTTTVFRDLGTQPEVFFPFHKEPHSLCYDDVLTTRGLKKYSSLFHRARPHQLVGEASTGYTKLPALPGVPERALRVLGPDVKIIYSVREPVARSLSHHFHLYLAGMAPADFEITLRQTPDLIDFSCYAMQIQPWIDTFGRNQIHVLLLEEYSRDRIAGLNELCGFLGIKPRPELIEQEAAFNAAEDKRMIPPWLAGAWRRTIWSSLYRSTIRPIIPDRLIGRLKKTLLRSAPPPPPPLGPDVVDRLINAFRADADKLREIMGRTQPLWDFELVRKKHIDAALSSSALGPAR
jgi:hypothetical protein